MALVLLSGCAHTGPPISALQRYDRMKRQLQWLTTQSQQLSDQTGRLGHLVSRANVPGTRRLAVRLKIAAIRYTTYAGRIGNSIRALDTGSTSSTAGRYLRFIADVLTWDWVEGTALQRVCDEIWRDPLSETGSGAETLYKDMRWAQRAAQRAVDYARLAAGVRRQAPGAFRYTVDVKSH